MEKLRNLFSHHAVMTSESGVLGVYGDPKEAENACAYFQLFMENLKIVELENGENYHNYHGDQLVHTHDGIISS